MKRPAIPVSSPSLVSLLLLAGLAACGDGEPAAVTGGEPAAALAGETAEPFPGVDFEPSPAGGGLPGATAAGAAAAAPCAGEPENAGEPGCGSGDPGLADGEAVAEAGAAPVSGETVRISLRAGENLVLLADQAGVSVEALCERNDLDPLAAVYPGEELVVPLAEGLSPADFAARRDAFLKGRLDRYAARRGGLVGVSEHRVRTGETGWGIAAEAGVAPWVLAAFNRDRDLDRLRIGEVLLVPVYADEPLAAGE